MRVHLQVPVKGGRPAERVLVVAPTRGDFEYWCRRNRISPTCGMVKWVRSSDDLRGTPGGWIVNLGIPEHLSRAEWERLTWMLAPGNEVFRFRNAEVIVEEA